jgi:hypothetical protein
VALGVCVVCAMIRSSGILKRVRLAVAVGMLWQFCWTLCGIDTGVLLAIVGCVDRCDWRCRRGVGGRRVACKR